MPNEKSVFDINGTQFPLHDANAVKYDRAQALTDAQKQQARANIGALGQASIYNGLDKQVLGFALDAYQGKVLNDSKTAVQNGLAIIVDGDTASMAVPVGSYAYIKNNVHGLSEGLYTNTSASAFPASGGMADSSVFTPVSGGGLNAIQQSLATVGTRYKNTGHPTQVGTGSFVTVGSVNVPAGIYLAIGHILFGSDATGRNIAFLTDNENDQTNSMWNCVAVNGRSALEALVYFNFDTDATIYLKAYKTTGTGNVDAGIEAIKLA